MFFLGRLFKIQCVFFSDEAAEKDLLVIKESKVVVIEVADVAKADNMTDEFTLARLNRSKLVVTDLEQPTDKFGLYINFKSYYLFNEYKYSCQACIIDTLEKFMLYLCFYRNFSRQAATTCTPREG